MSQEAQRERERDRQLDTWMHLVTGLKTLFFIVTKVQVRHAQKSSQVATLAQFRGLKADPLGKSCKKVMNTQLGLKMGDLHHPQLFFVFFFESDLARSEK